MNTEEAKNSIMQFVKYMQGTTGDEMPAITKDLVVEEALGLAKELGAGNPVDLNIGQFLSMSQLMFEEVGLVPSPAMIDQVLEAFASYAGEDMVLSADEIKEAVVMDNI